MSLFHALLGSGGSAEFEEPEAPSSDIVLKFNLFELSSMYQERSVFPSGMTTPVTVNTNPVGTILDQSLACTFLRATGATAIPVLAADGVKFDGSNDLLEVPTSTAYFKWMHDVAANRHWGMRFWLTRGTDGAARSPINNQGLSATQSGFYVQFTAANQLRFFLGDGTSPAIIDATHTSTLTAAEGPQPVLIDMNGDTLRIRFKGVTQTFSATAGQGSTNNATQNLRLGGDGTNFWSGSFSKSIEFVNRVWTAQEITDYEAYNPTITTNDFTPVKQWQLDFNDSNYIFSDSGETTPITNGGFIRSILSKSGKPNHSSAIQRKATSSSDAASPIWRQSQRNGKSTAEFDGSGTQNLTYSQDLVLECGGVYTLIFVLKNDDTVFGSHYMNGSPEYSTITGSGYSGNAGATGDAAQPYTVPHNATTTGPVTLVSRSNDYNILVIRVKAGSGDLWSQNKIKTTQANFGKFTSSLIGDAAPAGAADWDMDGHVALIEKYVGYLTDAQVEEKIDYLKSIYAISGVL